MSTPGGPPPNPNLDYEPSLDLSGLDEPAPTATETLERVRSFSEQLPVGTASASAALPFTLLIEGQLAPEEKARLLHLLTSQHDFGFREIELEPMFEAGRILLPRISEYAGILVVQALRSADVRVEFGPSELVFQSESVSDSELASARTASQTRTHVVTPALSDRHAAERIPITPEANLPGNPELEIVDTIMVSTAIHTSLVQAEHSEDYDRALETLQLELKYRAYSRGATAIVSFALKLDPLSDPSRYRITATGVGVVLRKT